VLTFLQKYGANVHSQNLEDGIIQECVRRIPDLNHVCVEVGANDGLWLSNTRLLIEQGWSGRMIESDFRLWGQCSANWKHNPKVKCTCSRVDGDNVNAFIDDSCDVLSLDTDGSDYEIFKGLRAKPKIVIVEVDSSIPPGDEGFNSEGGASYRTMLKLAIERGYFLLCHTGNLILVDSAYRHLFPEIVGDGLSNASDYFCCNWLQTARVGAA
jgi:hypothetical protein